ncbi:MAG: hypothetical protein SWH61_01300 [Thermodesulfobacteriota bacterium]|nr:hypothetical protein [Thermodesulfobacteriota bacterium]
MSDLNYNNLKTALMAVFSGEEAGHLAMLLNSVWQADIILYETVGLPDEIKDDYILMAYAERLLLPQASHTGGGAWQERCTTLLPGSIFVMPPVVYELIKTAHDSGRFNPDAAVQNVFRNKGPQNADQLAAFFDTIKPHAVSYNIEAGLIEVLNRTTALQLDLHDTIDCYVMAGMMSPCPGRSLSSGFAWYEINPALYW